MTVTTRWWWVRHAPVHNPEHRLYGQRDLDTVIDDPAPFSQLAERLPADALWLASHLKRTHQTADAVRPHFTARGHQAPDLVHLPEFAEQHFGDWQGMTFHELKDHLGDNFEAFWKSPGEARPPGGESFADVIDRVSAGIKRINEEHSGRHIVVFAHGGSIRSALALALGLNVATALSFQIHNLSLTRIDHIAPGESPPSGTLHPWRVEEVNHLHPEQPRPEAWRPDRKPRDGND